MSDAEERPKSYEKINYSLRAAKAIERKMIAEGLQRLHVFGPLKTYRYIGFGSTFFSDFSLFHRVIGITDMISIERDVENKDRFEFNRPYDCIKLAFTESTEFLAGTSWNVKTILWLDYDGKLEEQMLVDLKYACMGAKSGSVIMVSFNVHPDRYISGSENRLNVLRKRVGQNNVPIDVKEKDFPDWGTADVCHRIVDNVIRDTIAERNGLLTAGNKILYKQLFNIRYADGAKMLTVGGLLYNEAHIPLVDMCAFENLPFISLSNQSYLIEVPSLTMKEMRHLDKKLPSVTQDMLMEDNLSISAEDMRRYASIYRYFPAFAETNL